jgi:putative tryptophan/tyrosine transport system substrate-binding protein
LKTYSWQFPLLAREYLWLICKDLPLFRNDEHGVIPFQCEGAVALVRQLDMDRISPVGYEIDFNHRALEVRGPNPDYEGAFQAAAKGRASAIIAVSGPLATSYPKRIADLAIKNRLPSMHEESQSVEAGGLMSYSSSDTESFRRAATYVDKILKGAKPADLPVEQPTKFEFVINLKTAKQISVTIPPELLARASRLIK